MKVLIPKKRFNVQYGLASILPLSCTFFSYLQNENLKKKITSQDFCEEKWDIKCLEQSLIYYNQETLVHDGDGSGCDGAVMIKSHDAGHETISSMVTGKTYLKFNSFLHTKIFRNAETYFKLFYVLFWIDYLQNSCETQHILVDGIGESWSKLISGNTTTNLLWVQRSH